MFNGTDFNILINLSLYFVFEKNIIAASLQNGVALSPIISYDERNNFNICYSWEPLIEEPTNKEINPQIIKLIIEFQKIETE